jgi:hypothetical protein
MLAIAACEAPEPSYGWLVKFGYFTAQACHQTYDAGADHMQPTQRAGTCGALRVCISDPVGDTVLQSVVFGVCVLKPTTQLWAVILNDVMLLYCCTVLSYVQSASRQSSAVPHHHLYQHELCL